LFLFSSFNKKALEILRFQSFLFSKVLVEFGFDTGMAIQVTVVRREQMGNGPERFFLWIRFIQQDGVRV
jgi:hypothetical protein